MASGVPATYAEVCLTDMGQLHFFAITKLQNFRLKFQMVAEKTAKNFRGLLYFAAPCMWVTSQNGPCQNGLGGKVKTDAGLFKYQ